MEQTALVTAVMVTLSGPHISRHTIQEALEAAGVGNVEVTWSAPADHGRDDPWRITVATGHSVAVGALPADRQTAQELARYLSDVLHPEH